MAKLDQDLSGKVYVVTGANSGIGFEASRNFAARGARVVLICRSKEKGDAALANIEQETGNDQGRLYVADISSLEEVSALADRLLEDFLKIDVLCNNAGSANGRRTETREGFETTFVTNHLSGFLLTKKLMPALERASTSGLARVVFTSSYGHENSPLDFRPTTFRHSQYVERVLLKLDGERTSTNINILYSCTHFINSAREPCKNTLGVTGIVFVALWELDENRVG